MSRVSNPKLEVAVAPPSVPSAPTNHRKDQRSSSRVHALAGSLIEGLPFHKFYFDNVPSDSPSPRRHSSMRSPPGSPPELSLLPCAQVNDASARSCPHVRVIGSNVAVISYVRLTQVFDAKYVDCCSLFFCNSIVAAYCLIVRTPR
jgi:hypothetical protein